MKTPKVIFKYSRIYDEIWKNGWLAKARQKIEKYPSPDKTLNYLKEVEKLWRKEEKRVFQELAKITNLKWKTKGIDCYLVGKCTPFSYPLTMPVYEKSQDFFIDVLVHELIHNIFIQNQEETNKAFQYFRKKYKKESWKTQIHIPLHAIHSHIYYSFFNENRLKKDIEFMSSYPDYRKAWEIVQKNGYQNIINEFVKRRKSEKGDASLLNRKLVIFDL